MPETLPAAADAARPALDGALRVLLVEDDPGDALLVEELLLDAGLDVDLRHARTLEDAVGRLEVDCVLLDLGLPDGVGLPALRRVLDAGAPAVVVLTGLGDDAAGMQAVAAGAQDYLVKGEVAPATLSRSLRYAVQRRHLEDVDRALYRSQVRAQEALRLERALLPTPVVTDPGVLIEVGYRAGRDAVLGGDFYDAFERSDGSLLVVVGDVCGHGPDEAALGATLRTAWRTLVLAGTPTDGLLDLLERVLVAERSAPEIFTTLAMAQLAPDRRSLDLYLAGHPEPLLVGEPTVPVSTARRGRALGLPLPGRWLPERVSLDGCRGLLLYTDGLVEATVAGTRDRVGLDGLVDIVAAARVGQTPAGGTGADGADGSDGPDGSAAGEGGEPFVDRVLHEVRRRHGGDLADDAALLLVGAVR